MLCNEIKKSIVLNCQYNPGKTRKKMSQYNTKRVFLFQHFRKDQCQRPQRFKKLLVLQCLQSWTNVWRLNFLAWFYFPTSETRLE